jgi:hypothetical protein
MKNEPLTTEKRWTVVYYSDLPLDELAKSRPHSEADIADYVTRVNNAKPGDCVDEYAGRYMLLQAGEKPPIGYAPVAVVPPGEGALQWLVSDRPKRTRVVPDSVAD